jgi:hypothetical protein
MKRHWLWYQSGKKFLDHFQLLAGNYYNQNPNHFVPDPNHKNIQVSVIFCLFLK